MRYFTFGLLEAGAYEEAFVLMQEAMALARTLPPTINFQRFLTAMGGVYQALQKWEEAGRTLGEAKALSRLCMNYALAGEWEQAYRYAVQAITVRKSHDVALKALDFYSHYETEALLREGEERQARETVHRAHPRTQ